MIQEILCYLATAILAVMLVYAGCRAVNSPMERVIVKRIETVKYIPNPYTARDRVLLAVTFAGELSIGSLHRPDALGEALRILQVAENRSRLTGQPLAVELHREWQFSAWDDLGSQQSLQKRLGLSTRSGAQKFGEWLDFTERVLRLERVKNFTADHYYNPEVIIPDWATSKGVQVGEHFFETLGYVPRGKIFPQPPALRYSAKKRPVYAQPVGQAEYQTTRHLQPVKRPPAGQILDLVDEILN